MADQTQQTITQRTTAPSTISRSICSRSDRKQSLMWKATTNCCVVAFRISHPRDYRILWMPYSLTTACHRTRTSDRENFDTLQICAYFTRTTWMMYQNGRNVPKRKYWTRWSRSAIAYWCGTSARSNRSCMHNKGHLRKIKRMTTNDGKIN